MSTIWLQRLTSRVAESIIFCSTACQIIALQEPCNPACRLWGEGTCCDQKHAWFLQTSRMTKHTHLPNALRSASGEVRSLSDAEYKKLRRKLGTRSQVPGAIFHPGFAGFAPSTWETVVQAPQSAHATGVAARRTVKLWLEARNGGNASLLYVHYPRRCEVNWKTGRKAAMQQKIMSHFLQHHPLEPPTRIVVVIRMDHSDFPKQRKV